MAKKQKIDLVNFIPLELRNERSSSLLDNLFNRFLAEEKSVKVNGQIGDISDPTAAVIEATDLTREQNALVPALTFKAGVEDNVFVFSDLVAKLDALGVDTTQLHTMLAEQSLNYAPPIDLDKFVNFSNYYWFASSFGNRPPMPWNPTLEPEYYVQKQPPRTSTIKMPVKYVATRDLKLYGKDRAREKVTVHFNTPTLFYVTGDQGHLFINTVFNGNGTEFGHTLTTGVTKIWVFAPDLNDPKSNGYGRGDPNGAPDLLFNFTITLGNVPFEAGDKFDIDIEYVTGNNTISFTSVSGVETGKGYISNIVADSSLMYMDGVRLSVGDRVLVTAQNNAWENGIYTVRQGRWDRPIFYDTKEYLPQGSKIYITGGLTQAGSTWVLSRASDNTFIIDDHTNGAMSFTLQSTNEPSPVSDWQTTNFWAHRDVLSAVGLLDKSIQATRPIIEYFDQIQLNSYTVSNTPVDDSNPDAVQYTQKKTAFNQIPQFDLFYYDGTHAKKTSGLFFYVEDPDFAIDTELQRRLKTTINADYIFGVGIQDEDGRLLYFKNGTELKTIWAEGVTEPYSYLLDVSPPPA